MAKTISLTELKISRVVIDYDQQAVTVLYSMIDAAGKGWISGEATFFVTMPPQTPIYGEDGITIVGYVPYPDTWFQLPSSYIPTLVQLRDDADTALTARFLV